MQSTLVQVVLKRRVTDENAGELAAPATGLFERLSEHEALEWPQMGSQRLAVAPAGGADADVDAEEKTEACQHHRIEDGHGGNPAAMSTSSSSLV